MTNFAEHTAAALDKVIDVMHKPSTLNDIPTIDDIETNLYSAPLTRARVRIALQLARNSGVREQLTKRVAELAERARELESRTVA